MTDRESVERFGPYAVDGGCDAYGQMEADDFGDWVRFEDYAALLTRAEAAEAALLATCQRETETMLRWESRLDAAEAALTDRTAERNHAEDCTRAAVEGLRSAEAELAAREAKLALAVEALEYYAEGTGGDGYSIYAGGGVMHNKRRSKARAALAQLTADTLKEESHEAFSIPSA